MGGLYVLLGFDLLAWGGLASLGFSSRFNDPYWTLHAPYYAWLPAKVAVSVVATIILLAAAGRLDRLKPAAGPIGGVVGLLGLVGLPAYLLFYTGGI